MKMSTITRHRAGTTFVFVFFLIFLLCSGLLIPRILNVYDGIVNRADITNNESIVLEYLSGAVKRSDSSNSISITSLNDSTPVLSVTQDNTTWMYYCRDGYLYIQNARKSELTAERLCEAGNMWLSESNGMILVEYISPDNTMNNLILTPRCGITGGTQ